jgi:hypothetical protein
VPTVRRQHERRQHENWEASKPDRAKKGKGAKELAHVLLPLDTQRATECPPEECAQSEPDAEQREARSVLKVVELVEVLFVSSAHGEQAELCRGDGPEQQRRRRERRSQQLAWRVESRQQLAELARERLLGL